MVLIAAAASSAAVLMVSAEEEGEGKVTVTGYVDVAEEDDSGQPMSVFIDDYDKGYYLVANEGKGKELLRHIGEEVEAQGVAERLDSDPDYDFLLRVSSFRLLSEEEGEDDEEN
jgi:hypothetical protein